MERHWFGNWILTLLGIILKLLLPFGFGRMVKDDLVLLSVDLFNAALSVLVRATRRWLGVKVGHFILIVENIINIIQIVIYQSYNKWEIRTIYKK